MPFSSQKKPYFLGAALVILKFKILVSGDTAKFKFISHNITLHQVIYSNYYYPIKILIRLNITRLYFIYLWLDMAVVKYNRHVIHSKAESLGRAGGSRGGHGNSFCVNNNLARYHNSKKVSNEAAKA